MCRPRVRAGVLGHTGGKAHGYQCLDAPKVQEVRARGVLRVAVRQEQSPRGVHLDLAHLQTRALEVALAKAIAKTVLGDENKVEIRSGPAREIVGSVVAGQVDLGLATIFHAPTTDALKQQVEVSEPYAIGGVALAIKTGSGIGTVRGLEGKKVAAIDVGRDYRPDFQAFAASRGLNFATEQHGSYDEAAAAMEGGQVQAMLGHTIALAVYGAEHPGRIALLGRPFTDEQSAVIATKGDGELIALVNEVLRELKRSGELRRLAEDARFPTESLALP